MEYNNTATLYFEVHVTIDPVQEGPRMALLKQIAESHGYHVAKLLMRKGATIEPHGDDAFLTTRGVHLQELRLELGGLVRQLKTYHFVIRRYKIEDTIIDSARADEYQLLT